MKGGSAQKISNMLLSGLAGVASFIFSLYAFLTVTRLPEQIAAAIVAGAFCLIVCYVASERPNSEGARALTALRDRLLVRPILGSTSSFLLRRDVLRAAGGFDAGMPSAQDYELTLRLVRSGGRLACVPGPLLYYRSSSDKMSLRVEAVVPRIE